MTSEDRFGGYTPARATKFYVPLLLQAFFQSLTYPLVASIVTHGPLGVRTLTAFAQGQTVMFMIGALGGGLVMTGMVFAKSRSGYRAFVRLNNRMMLALLGVQLFFSIPPHDALLFQTLLNLPPDLAGIARETLLWGLVMQAGFFLRNIPLVILFNARDSFRATLATVVRILLTLAAPALFIRLGWTGALWGLVAMTIPCLMELLLTWLFARRYVRTLPEGAPSESAWTQFRFTLPLSFGGVLLATAPLMVAAFVGRTENAVLMLAVHYVTIGLANPVAYAALRMQPVAIQFPPEYPGDRRMIRYALCAGLVLGVIPLLTALPGLSDWYFRIVQNVPAEEVRLARIVMACYAVWPAFQCLRGYAEGLAARIKHPSAVLLGQAVNLAVLTAVLAISLKAGMPGWLMGFCAILAATLATLGTVCAALRRHAPIAPPYRD